MEDTPFVVTDVVLIEQRESFFNIQLNDETEEPLDLDSLSVGKDNVLYCAVKSGKFKARFLRPSYYRLTEHMLQEGEDRFYIPLNGKKYLYKQGLVASGKWKVKRPIHLFTDSPIHRNPLEPYSFSFTAEHAESAEKI